MNLCQSKLDVEPLMACRPLFPLRRFWVPQHHGERNFTDDLEFRSQLTPKAVSKNA